MYDLKFQAIIKQIMQSSGTIIILRSKNKNISVLNTKYAKHYVKGSKYLVSFHTIVRF